MFVQNMIKTLGVRNFEKVP